VQSYTRATQTVEAFQLPWNMTIVVNSKNIAGVAGQWLIIPPPGQEPYFMDDLTFEAQFTVVVEPPA
jgi:hypothetical protein